MSIVIRRQPTVAALALAALAALGPLPAAAAPKPYAPRLMLTPGLPNVACALHQLPNGPALCPVFVVQTFVVLDPSGAPSGCLASMSYNELTMVLGVGARSGTITWEIPAATPAKFVANEKGVGIWLAPGPGLKPPSDLFSPAVGTISANGKQVTLTTLTGAKPAVGLNHLPIVEYMLAPGKPIECLGVDPVITNSDS